MTALQDLEVPGRHHVYELKVTDTAGRVETSAIGTFEELSAAIDKAMSAPGFVRYQVGPAGGR